MGRATYTTTRRSWARVALAGGIAVTSGVAIGTTPASPVHAVSITVTSNSDLVGDDGLCTLREAIAAANTNVKSGSAVGECPAGAPAPTIDTIILANGATYELKSGLPPLPVISEPLLIQGNSATIDANGLHRVFENLSTLELFALTLQNGVATGAGNAGAGGAIYNTGTLRTSAVTFTNNEANDGGAIFNSGTIDIRSSHFTDNTAAAGGAIEASGTATVSAIYGGTFTGNHSLLGGAIALGGGITVISDTAPGPISTGAPLFSDNHADPGGLGHGGAIYHSADSLTVTGAQFSLNSADGSGGAIFTFANATIERSNISQNLAHDGGGIAAGAGSAVSVVESVIHDNDAITSSGGGVVVNGGMLQLTRSTVSGNTAASFGGGIYGAQSGSVIDVAGSTISGNVATAGGGGGISSRGTLTVTHSTIASNEGNETTGYDDAGGVQTWFSPASTTITASIIADNTTASVDGGPTNDVGMRNTTVDGYISGGGNLIESVLETTIGPAGAITAFDGDDDRVGVDPGLAALADNGGPTETHAITATSPAVDLVAVTVPDAPSTDQRGEPRTQGTLPDAGAYELSCASAPTNIADGNDWLFAIGCFNEPSVTTPVALTLTGNPVVGATAVVDNSSTTLAIDGPAHTVTGDGFVGSLLRIEPGSDVSLTGFSMTSGDAGTGDGGAIDNAGTLVAENMTFTGNSTASGIGGSINNSGTATLTRVAINDSSAFWGGGIANSGTLDIIESGISDNSAFGRGGGIYHWGGVLDVDRSLVSGNRSGEALGASGGGIWTAAAATITNSTISGNSAVGEGGAIEHDDGSLLVEFSTVTDNAVDGAGTGGIRTGATVGAMSLRASIVHGNTNLDLGKAPGSAAIGDLGANVLGALGGTVTEFTDGDTEGNRVGADPQLGPLAGNGGPTFTHAIGGTSPAIDLVVTPDADDPAVDQRGVTRPALGFSDAGAFEGECGDFSFPWVVSESAQWPRAIECYNLVTAPGSYVIEIATDIVADALTSIDNGSAGVELVVDGGGHTLSAASADIAVSVGNSTVVEITDLTITHNEGVTGRGINNSGDVVLRRVALVENNATGNGGGLNNGATATAVVIDSLITGNTAGDGAGIRTAGDLTLINSTVTGNIADADGGGLLVTPTGSASIEFSTITRNSALDGGGIGVDDGGTATLVASIVAENSSPDLAATSGSSDPFTRGAFNVLGVLGSFIGTGAATDLEGVTDAGLEPLADNGGPTVTHALEPASVARDLVTAAVGSDPAADQRGVSRPIADAKDAGAFEASCSGSPWIASSENTLRHAISCFNAEPTGAHTIDISADIDLTASLPTIDNTNASLLIDGQGFAIDGGSGGSTSPSGFRMFDIAAGSTVEMSALAILGGDAQLGAGGGIRNAGDLTLTGVTVSDNYATAGGGGISSSGALTVTDSEISSNQGGQFGGPGGGGIHAAASSTLTVTDSLIQGNISIGEGGGIDSLAAAEVIIEGSTIADNFAQFGAGIHTKGPMSVVNSTITGQSCACVGAGIHVGVGGSLDLSFSTVTNNSSIFQYTGISAATGQAGSVTITASIVAGNSNGSGSGEDVATSGGVGDPFVSGGFNVIGSVEDGITAFDADLTDTAPLLGDLADNGGPTPTHAPLAGSPAIGLVTGSVAGSPDVDQRGTARPQFVLDDAGAVECTQGFCDGDADDDGDTDSVDNCVNDPNPGQGDVDGDGVGDVCDPLQDSDGDLVADDDDNCPADANPRQADSDGDGIGDACDPPTDSDGDGVADGVDNCPADANPRQGDADGDGIGDVCDPTPEPPVADVAVFTSLDPARFADTRDLTTFDMDFVNTGPRPSGDIWEIDIAGRGDVPVDAVAVIINLTLLNSTGPGFATAYPCTPDVPNASSVNYAAGTVNPNEVITKLSGDGTICVFTLTQADMIIDVVGYASAESPYTAITPTRYADSRDEDTFDNQFRDTGPRPSGTVWEIPVAGRGTIPTTATTAIANVTVTGGTGPGFATVYPCTDDIPDASSLNYDLGVTIPNEVVTKLSPTGTICIFTLTTTDVVVDIVGYLETTPTFTSITPTRYADSRDLPTFDNQFRNTGPRDDDSVWEIQIAGRGDIPADATTAVANLTITQGGGPGFATAYPCTDDIPDASSLNYGAGTTRPNELITKLSPTGTLCIYTLTTTHLIIDITGHNGT